MKLMLVYQAGIANVFIVEQFDMNSAARRNAKRVMQNAFVACEYFVRGAACAGAIVKVASCNHAGDIIGMHWTAGMDDCPFRDNANPFDNSAE